MKTMITRMLLAIAGAALAGCDGKVLYARADEPSIVFTQPLADAIAAPRFHQDAAVEDILYERDRAPRAIVDALMAMGHGVRATDSIGNVSAVGVYGERIFAVADPRHGGAAGGY